jgi:hypothetical protein
MVSVTVVNAGVERADGVDDRRALGDGQVGGPMTTGSVAPVGTTLAESAGGQVGLALVRPRQVGERDRPVGETSTAAPRPCGGPRGDPARQDGTRIVGEHVERRIPPASRLAMIDTLPEAGSVTSPASIATA